MAIFARKRDNPPGVGPRRQPPSAPQRLPLLLALSGLAALSLRRAPRGASDWDGDGVGEGDASFRRALRTCHGGDVLGDTDLLAIPADGAWESLSGAHHAGADAAAGVDLGVAFPLAQRLNADRPFPHFTLQDAAGVARMYRSGFALLVYDPADDAFQTFYFKEHVEAPSRHAKLMKTVPLLANMLRTTFPERFQGETSDELGK